MTYTFCHWRQLYKLAEMTQVTEQTSERLPESIDSFLQPTSVTDLKGECCGLLTAGCNQLTA